MGVAYKINEETGLWFAFLEICKIEIQVAGQATGIGVGNKKPRHNRGFYFSGKSFYFFAPGAALPESAGAISLPGMVKRGLYTAFIWSSVFR